MNSITVCLGGSSLLAVALDCNAAEGSRRPLLDVYFNTAIFPTQAQAPYTLQNFPTMFPDVRGKILNVVDASVYKEFPIKEKVKWQIRADFHNAFNHPWFGTQGSNDVTSSTFGQLFVYSVDANSEPRLIVAVMKIIF